MGNRQGGGAVRTRPPAAATLTPPQLTISLPGLYLFDASRLVTRLAEPIRSVLFSAVPSPARALPLQWTLAREQTLRQRSFRNWFHAMSTNSAGSVTELRRADLEACQAKIGYVFRDVQLLEAALTHASGVQHRLASNERMEFLGDAILGLVVCERLFHQYPEYSEGELTKIKSVVVSRDACARLSEALALQEHLVLGKGMAADPSVPRSVLAAAFESLVAAIYLDGGMPGAERFILDHVVAEIDAAVSSEFGGNFKSLLQQLAQREHGVTPSYQLLDEKGPDHSKCFKVAAQIGKRRFPPAWGKSKKESEQRAAHNAISELRGESEPYPSEETPELELHQPPDDISDSF